MKKIVLLLICCPCFLWAQLFENASDNLPDNGARGQSMDVQAADIDGDGDLDILLANEFQANTILRNDGQGHFTNGSVNLPQEVHDSEDVALADFDRDGDLDLFFCSEDDITLGWSNVHEFYLNDGQGNFTRAAYQLPDTKANAIIALHINDDDWPDIILGNDGQNRVFINNGDLTFSEETASRFPVLVDVTQDIHAVDVDQDGDQDLFFANEDGNRLLINDSTGVFTDESQLRLPQGLNIETRKASFADVDGNGSLDVFLSNVAFIPGRDFQNRLWLNDGNGFFSDVTDSQLPIDQDFTLDAVFTDIDDDQDLDLISTGIGIVANSISILPIKVFLNDGQGFFSEATETILGDLYGLKGLGIIMADLNGDGLEDIYACDRTDNTANTKDVLLFKKKISNSSEGLEKETKAEFYLYPRPAKNGFKLAAFQRQKDKFQFHLLDAKGKDFGVLIANEEKSGELWSFDLELVPGLYYLLIKKEKAIPISLPLIIVP